jgi:hypothetical protein
MSLRKHYIPFDDNSLEKKLIEDSTPTEYIKKPFQEKMKNETINRDIIFEQASEFVNQPVIHQPIERDNNGESESLKEKTKFSYWCCFSNKKIKNQGHQ